MTGTPLKLAPALRILVGLLLLCGAATGFMSSAKAQSEDDVRVAVDRLRQTLVSTTNELKATQKATTASLEAEQLNSSNQLLSALTQMTAVLAAIQNQQEKRTDNNYLYCNLNPASPIGPVNISVCTLSSNPTVSFPSSLADVQAGGWRLIAMGGSVAVYSRYSE